MIFFRGVNAWRLNGVILSGAKQAFQEHHQNRCNYQVTPDSGGRHHRKNIILPVQLLNNWAGDIVFIEALQVGKLRLSMNEFIFEL